jgi:uncharacterized protein YciI
MHYLLIYEVAADYLERCGTYREEHLTLAWAAQARGEPVLASALTQPADGAVLLFTGDSGEAAAACAAADPYVRHGLIRSWRVREWTTVVGAMASTPVRPP